MLDIAKVLEYFALFSGLPQAEAERWQSICENAAALLLGRLREGVDPGGPANAGRLCAAAAACACCDYLLLSAAPTEEVRVGSVSLKPVTARNAEAVRERFLAGAADLLEGEGFAFRLTEEPR